MNYQPQAVSSQVELLRLIDGTGIRYAILHGWEKMLEEPSSDIDIVVAQDDVKRLERHLKEWDRYQVVQRFHYEATSFGLVLASRDTTGVHFTTLDVSTDYRSKGRIFFTGESLLHGRTRWNGFWTLAPEKEFAFLLVKKIVEKGYIPEHQRKRLEKLYQALGEEAKNIVRMLLGSPWGERVALWIRDGSPVSLEASMKELKKALRFQVAKLHPFNRVHYWLTELPRICRRWKRPTGLFVAVLGPDGAGKSTLIQCLRDASEAPFRSSAVFHLRPHLFERKRSNAPATNPHAEPPRSWWLSMLKIPYYVMDYLLGYLIEVRPRLVRSTLCVFDRYYDDLLVDPRRYRYSGSMKYLLLARTFIPKPNLSLILDVPAEKLRERKQEASLDEIKRQLEAYRQLVKHFPNTILLDGSLPAREVARNANDAALDFLHERYRERRMLWFSDNHSEALNWLASILSSSSRGLRFFPAKANKTQPRSRGRALGSFIFLPLKDGRGYLIPQKPRSASVQALNLYSAHTPTARLLKGLLGTGLKTGLAQPLLRKVYLHTNDGNSGEDPRNNLLVEHFKRVMGERQLSIAVSLGTPGLHRKPVIQVLTGSGKVLGYAKVGWSEATNAMVKNEASALARLEKFAPSCFMAPRVLYAGLWNGRYICLESAPEGKVEPAPRQMMTLYFDALKELATLHERRIPLGGSDFWKNLLGRLRNVPKGYQRSLVQQGILRVEEQLARVDVVFQFRHGDFAPWNAKRVNQRLFLFDWEYAEMEAPVGFDLFHFFLQTFWEVAQQRPYRFFQQFQKGGAAGNWMRRFMDGLGIETNTVDTLLGLYLLDEFALQCSVNPNSFRALQDLSVMIDLSTSNGDVKSHD